MTTMAAPARLSVLSDWRYKEASGSAVLGLKFHGMPLDTIVCKHEIRGIATE